VLFNCRRTHRPAAWCGLQDWSSSVLSLTRSGRFSSFLGTCAWLQVDWSSDKLVHILKTNQGILVSSLILKCLNKHLPLCWLPYGPAALLSHAVDMVLLSYSLTEARFRAVMSSCINPLHCTILWGIDGCIERMKFRAVMEYIGLT
jgi:hypothetical protein